MNRAHHLINGIAGNGKARQRGTHRYELINGTAMGTEKQGSAAHIYGEMQKNRKDNEQNM